MRARVACLAVALCAAAGCAQPSLEVMAVANTGFLVRSSSHAVLVDALFRATAPYPKFFQQAPSENLLDLMVGSGGAFEHVDLVLVTHADGDHFHAQTVADFLRAHDESVVVATEEAEAALAEVPGRGAVLERVIAPAVAIGACGSIEANGIPVSVCRMRHSGEATANNVYVVELDGFHFLHEGDAEQTKESFGRLATPEQGLDVAFLHDRFVFDPDTRKILTEILRPRAVVLTHLRWDAAAAARQRLADLDPEVVQTLPPVTVLGAETARTTFERTEWNPVQSQRPGLRRAQAARSWPGPLCDSLGALRLSTRRTSHRFYSNGLSRLSPVGVEGPAFTEVFTRMVRSFHCLQLRAPPGGAPWLLFSKTSALSARQRQ